MERVGSGMQKDRDTQDTWSLREFGSPEGPESLFREAQKAQEAWDNCWKGRRDSGDTWRLQRNQRRGSPEQVLLIL